MGVLTLYIRTDNAAFDGDPSPEIARLLRKIADTVEAEGAPDHWRTIRDLNGNDTGRYTLAET